MSYLLVRHGQTALNAARVFQPLDTPLSPLGLAQADALAARLRAGPRPAAVLASDLERAAQTAQAVAHAWGLAVEHTPLLRERDFGELRGLPYDTLGFNAIEMEDAPPGGESLADVRQRALAAWALLQQRQAALGAPLVVVSHGAFLRSLFMALGVPGVQGSTRLDNTSVTELQAQPPHACLRLNCTAHLPPELQEPAHSLVGG